MRTIETTLYEFGELNQDAKQTAIDNLREPCVQSLCSSDMDDAMESQKLLEAIAHVKADIEYSSHGYHCRWYKNTDPQYDKTDKDLFDQFKKDFEEQFRGLTWAHDLLYEIVQDYSFNDGYSYENNIASILVEFANKVERCWLCYYDDDYVIEWIYANEFMFYECGLPVRDDIL
jgi:hypothetical protein